MSTALKPTHLPSEWTPVCSSCTPFHITIGETNELLLSFPDSWLIRASKVRVWEPCGKLDNAFPHFIKTHVHLCLTLRRAHKRKVDFPHHKSRTPHFLPPPSFSYVNLTTFSPFGKYSSILYYSHLAFVPIIPIWTLRHLAGPIYHGRHICLCSNHPEFHFVLRDHSQGYQQHQTNQRSANNSHHRT